MTLLLETEEATQDSRLKTHGVALDLSLQPVDRFGIDWAGRSVVVVGLGKSGLAACRLLQRIGSEVRVSELRDSQDARALVSGLRESGVREIELGSHSHRLLDGCDAVVVSPGVPESAAPIQWAQQRAIPILSEVELAFRFCAAPIVAVTGTNGKSSVVTLIHRVLQAARRAGVACGNLGTPCSDVLPSLSAETIAVVELSSFQLLGCEEFRPSIGVLLNLGINHLDRHHDRESYIAAKARLFRRQTPQDYAVLNAADPSVVALSREVAAQHVWFGAGANNPPALHLDPATCQLLPENLQAVLQVARLLGVPDPLTYQTIREFRGLEHRFERIAMIRGVHVINDSKSTTPESLLYALQRCRGPVVPIVGGKDKGLDFSHLATALVQERIHGIVLIGESRHRLRALLKNHATEISRSEISQSGTPAKLVGRNLGSPLTSKMSRGGAGGGSSSKARPNNIPHPRGGDVIVRECETLGDAVQEALTLARPGDTVLFSPACASFDMFKNFEERGATFKQLVHQFQRDVHSPSCKLQATSSKPQATSSHTMQLEACGLRLDR